MNVSIYGKIKALLYTNTVLNQRKIIFFLYSLNLINDEKINIQQIDKARLHRSTD